MIWYLSFQVLAVVLWCGLVYTWFKFRKDKVDDFIEFSVDRWKILLYSYIAVFIIVTLVLIVPLKNTLKCSIHGTSMKTYTSYSWVLGQCLMRTKTGAMLPININRDNPEGELHDVTN